MALSILAGCAHEEAQPPTDEPARAASPEVQSPTRAPTVAAAPAPAPSKPEAPTPHLEGPSLEDWKPVKVPPRAPVGKGFTHVAIVTDLQVPLYSKTNGGVVVGYSGVGSRLPARPTDDGCEDGKWLAVSGGAWLCSGEGLVLKAWGFKGQVLDALAQRRVPKVKKAWPYDNGKAQRSAPLLKRLPTGEELALLTKGETPEDLVDRRLEGTYLLTLVDKIKSGTEEFYETLTGEFIRASLVKPFKQSFMHGERLGKTSQLPLAFTYRPAKVFCLGREDATPCGTAEKHARFPAGEVLEAGDRTFVVLDDGLAVPRDHVRIAQKVERPETVDADDQWIHIDLSEQTIVAYEGDTPVYATLISTGKPGHDTPTGLYQVNRVYLTKPMNGVDEDGPYQVQEVPWTMYFKGNYALHGAYWHDIFGHTKSHGCVNIPPVDARWIYYWAKPRMPRGWTVKLHAQGPHVLVTGQTPPDTLKEQDA